MFLHANLTVLYAVRRTPVVLSICSRSKHASITQAERHPETTAMAVFVSCWKKGVFSNVHMLSETLTMETVLHNRRNFYENYTAGSQA
jgi:hypothetical protein